MASLDSVKAHHDRISNLPGLVIDKILKRLPLQVTAKTSILSRTWRRNWLSCNYVTFDHAFWRKFRKGEDYDLRKGSRVISNILFHHNGCIHSFLLEITPCHVRINASLTQWLIFLSKTCPKKIAIINWDVEFVCMPSYIFHCTELTKLQLRCFVLDAPPFDFKGFPYLRTLELVYIAFKHGFDMLWSLIAKCPCLVRLTIDRCCGMDLVDVDALTLEKLIIKGLFDSLSLKNCPHLVDVSLCSTKSQISGTETLVATIKSLASSYGLECLAIKGTLFKLLVAGGINKSLPLAFNQLNRLCLEKLPLNDRDVFYYTIGMIQSCPFIKEREISVSSTSDIHHQNYEYNTDYYMLGMLQEVKIRGITGSIAELRLIEYVLAVSTVLEKIILIFATPEDVSKFKAKSELMHSSASPKVQLICLDKSMFDPTFKNVFYFSK